MSGRIGISTNVGHGVHVGASTNTRGLGGSFLLWVFIMPGVIWFATGMSILGSLLGSVLGLDTHLDMDKARLNLICFAVTLVELAVYFLFL